MVKEKKVGPLSRRDFLKAAGIGAGALALGQLTLVEAALLPKAPRSEKFDVIVIGTGLAGLSAALEAKLSGANVVILEKMEQGKDGGNSKIAGGAIVIPAENTKKSMDEFYEDFMKKSIGRGNTELSRIIADRVLADVEWLKSYGCEFLAPVVMTPYRVKSVNAAPAQFVGMSALLGKLRQAYLSKGGKIVYRVKAKQLVMDGNGRIVGVKASGAGGMVDYMAGAVIIATGGYAANREVLETFVDPNADEMMVRGVPWATGDGLFMAREAGATLVNMGGLASLHVAAVSSKNTSSGNPSRAIPFCLGINREGKRYVDESKGYVANGKAALKQPGQTVAMIFDEEIKKKEGMQISWNTFNRLGIPMVEADTLEALATKIDVSPAQLVQTVNEFNSAVAEGKAMSANPPKTAAAFKVMTPKFYAFYPLVPGITLTFGGIRINGKGQVTEADGSTIPGLYAAGECAGGVYYDDYIGGSSLANCLVMGRIAGKEAAAEKGKAKKRAAG